MIYGKVFGNIDDYSRKNKYSFLPMGVKFFGADLRSGAVFGDPHSATRHGVQTDSI